MHDVAATEMNKMNKNKKQRVGIREKNNKDIFF